MLGQRLCLTTVYGEGLTDSGEPTRAYARYCDIWPDSKRNTGILATFIAYHCEDSTNGKI